MSVQLFNDLQTGQVANKNHKALPSASVDKWGCHIKSGTWLDEVSPTLRHSVILDDVLQASRILTFKVTWNVTCHYPRPKWLVPIYLQEKEELY